MVFRFAVGLLVGALLAGGALYARRVALRDAAERAMAARMHAFVRALGEPPANAHPATHWRPLAREPVRCATCHAEEGERMERRIASGDLPVDRPAPALDHDAMVRLMERWVRRLNREAAPVLHKAVVCLDCHETDPRRQPG